MGSGFRLQVKKGCLVSLQVDAVKFKGKQVGKPVAVSFYMPDADGDRFGRCLTGLREGDVVEVRFLPFLPKGGSL